MNSGMYGNRCLTFVTELARVWLGGPDRRTWCSNTSSSRCYSGLSPKEGELVGYAAEHCSHGVYTYIFIVHPRSKPREAFTDM